MGGEDRNNGGGTSLHTIYEITNTGTICSLFRLSMDIGTDIQSAYLRIYVGVGSIRFRFGWLPVSSSLTCNEMDGEVDCNQ